MDSSSRLHIADASVIINLNASGFAREVIAALQGRFVVLDIVLSELESGRPKGRQDAAQLRQMIEDGAVDLVTLDEEAEEYFARLIIGPAESTLDDGEAATIAYAAQQAAVALMDERKATRLCAAMFPAIVVQNSVELFAHADVLKALGSERRASALFNALVQGRMRVPPHLGDWVIGEIGPERALLCLSLPSHLRVGKKS